MEARLTSGLGTRVVCKGRDVHGPDHMLTGQQLAAIQGDLGVGRDSFCPACVLWPRGGPLLGWALP